MIAVLIAAILFARGARHARVSISRHIAFWLGLSALYVALHTRLDYFFEHEFFIIGCNIWCCITSGRF